ncbi:hypothetical protein [Maridesulfovibrio zosterae]|uniref:hypothetical protein n=1 Tax=Maridesulfovibrio zosterae TaxID=82171 RepID=UPI0004184A00|nr:hypothetical protein [Maridesulfovibrio zosterae]
MNLSPGFVREFGRDKICDEVQYVSIGGLTGLGRMFQLALTTRIAGLAEAFFPVTLPQAQVRDYERSKRQW